MAEPVQARVELFWFQDCPNHAAARVLLDELLGEFAPGTAVHEIDATDPSVAQRYRFPGSPTIRVDGRDVDPSYRDPRDYTPRCRLYRTTEGLRGLPERSWVETALRAHPRIPRQESHLAGARAMIKRRHWRDRHRGTSTAHAGHAVVAALAVEPAV